MTATFHVGDAIEVMGKLSEKSVDLVLTSPPFLALRSYLPADHPDKALEGGSQATPGEYIDWLVDVVEACDRVLAPHGSMCIELGDTYAGSGGAGGDYLAGGWRDGQNGAEGSKYAEERFAKSDPKYGSSNFKGGGPGGTGWPLAKSLSLIPELFRFTLVYGTNPLTGRQTDRWRLRNVVRWVRPNPPVGALGDKFRPATSELMVFCKSAKRYFDLDAVRSVNHPDRMTEPSMKSPYNKTLGNHTGDGDWHPAGAPPLDWWNIPPGGYEGAHYAVFPPELCIKPIKAMCPEKVCKTCGQPSVRETMGAGWLQAELAVHIKERREALGLTRREVDDWFGFNGMASHWEDSDKQPGIPGADVWPILKERLGLADTFDAAIRRRDGYEYVAHGNPERQNAEDYAQARMGQNPSAQAMPKGRATKIAKDDIKFSDCGHDDWRPGLVLDPFGGSGTTALVATGHGRDCILIDLDERNYELALQRVGPFILERAG